MSRTQVATVASFLNVAQRVGGAFGIALLNTLVTQATHVHAVRMGAALPPLSPRLEQLAQQMQAGASAGHSAAAFAARTIYHRASVLGFENGFVFAGLILLAGLPLCLMLVPTVTRAPGKGAQPSGAPRMPPADGRPAAGLDPGRPTLAR